MKYDKPLIAGVIGAASTIIGEVVTRGLTMLGFGEYSIYQLISLVITFNRPTLIIGFIVDCIAGGFIGIILYYALIILERDYLVVKGVATSLFFWFGAEMIFTSTIEGRFIPLRPISDYYVHLIGATAYGVTMGLLFKTYLFHARSRQVNDESNLIFATPAFKHCPTESNEHLKELVEKHEQLLTQIIHERKENKRSFWSRFKFW
ncbi:hypothetical protein SOV_32480 [Sporomusa ovata DSM 2662]|uniref:Predicted membrane protein n=1 Tax=Sporomusa ovata TaxID=2378 RepID=A0A0U1L4F5_9FIRM|nr:hypothetical protein [Sporomusa ovata]EQB25203.1 hypothetical protein SOV_5c03530 [Sporomusa ovata DSM 2662]CQR73764.1 Predicted membrane protein [Sporomusa ovata]